MSCEWLIPRLSALADGELSALSSVCARQHLRRCPKCEREWRSLMRLGELILASDLVPSDRRVRSKPEGTRIGIPRWVAGASMTAAAVWGLIVLLPGAIVHPSVAFADVERAMKRVRTAAWIQTESMYVDGVEEYAVVTEHWARLTPPAYATRNRPDRRQGARQYRTKPHAHRRERYDPLQCAGKPVHLDSHEPHPGSGASKPRPGTDYAADCGAGTIRSGIRPRRGFAPGRHSLDPAECDG
jgi:hypothetical protein